MSDQEQEDTDTTSEDTTEENTTFQIGDYKTFLLKIIKYLLILLVALSIGFHILYSCRHGFDDFINEYFPTDETKSPFCRIKDINCKRSIFYQDTNIEVKKYINGTSTMVKEPYEPDFNIDIIKKTNMTTGEIKIEGKYDDAYDKWLLYWWNNTYIKMNIYNNKIFKFIFELMHNSIDINKPGWIDSCIVFLGSFFVIFIFKLVMPFVTIFNFLRGGCMAYKKYAWILTFPVLGGLFFAFLHAFSGNAFQAVLSLFGAGCGTMLQPTILFIALTTMVLPIIKFIRLYGWNLIMMVYSIVELLMSKLNNVTLDNPIDKPEIDDKYNKMISYFSEFSTGIFMIVSFIVLTFAYKYLVYPIFIGMTLCSIYLLFTSYFSKKQ
jgi:hypothetical protein